MPVLGEATFEAAVQKVMRQQNVNRASAERIVGSAEKKQKKARLLKLRMAAVGISFDEKLKRRERVNKPKKTVQGTELYNVSDKEQNKEMTQRRLKQEKGYINTGAPIRPTKTDMKTDVEIRRKLAKEQRLAKEHGHAIVFKGVPHGPYKVASLNQQSGRYAKYWLLNAKQTNGNGWGIAAHTAKDNMKKFLGRPLVVTSASWHGASEYGNSYEHPYLPTNDLNKIFDHQEKFRVGSIVDVQEDKAGDWYATIEMLPKFANMNLPPFCSPAIYQLDASEHEGQISKWEALHLAALDENPAYGARIALLKGSCVGTKDSCTVQFKSAKQLNATIYDEDVANSTKKQKKKKMFDKNNPKFRGIMEAQVVCPKKVANIKEKIANLKKKQKVAIVRSPDKFKVNREMKHTRVDSAGPLINKVPFGDEDRSTKQQYVDRQMRDSSYELSKGKKVYPPKPTQKDRKRIIKAKLASLGEQKIAYEGGSKYDRQITDLQNNFKGQRNEITKRRPDNLVGRQPENAFGHKCTNEATCGATSGFLGLKLMTEHGLDHKQVKVEGGMYTGPGAEYSSATFKDNTGKPQVGHEWIRLDDGTIIDGSSGQFMNQENKINQDQRLRVIPPNAPLQKYYRPHYYKNPLIQKRQWYDKNDPLKKSIEKYEKTMRLGKLKSKIASLGEQNMTYQNSKKVKIHKKKHPEVRKAKSNVEDILRKAGSSVDGSHHQSTFLSPKGDFIGGGDIHDIQIRNILDPTGAYGETVTNKFIKEHGLGRVQTFPINRAGEKKTSVHFNSKATPAQIKAVKDLETGGRDIGFLVGDETGSGSRDFIRALGRLK